ncbi:family 43 glycosylhydrolase [Streptomyces sp. NPDC093591]|uniref:family 43 glycosylhydrolase n=1 Tax=Streptomyces sp. NPDC093591 TaxID=3366044 RepID=UPI0037FAA94E
MALARGRQGSTTYLFTASDPAGPWSEPIVLEADGIDPSLFFDDDGRCWFTACRDAAEPAVTGPGELYLRELDLDTLALTGPTMRCGTARCAAPGWRRRICTSGTACTG